jgi:rhodanese-related sulfurtransferase
MKTLQLLILMTLLFGSASALPAQNAAPPADPYWDNLVKGAKSRIKEVTPDQLTAMQKAEPALVVVDVREDNEWDVARAAGAVHVSRGTLEKGITGKVARKDTPVVLYCHSGARSALAAETLGTMGYTRVYSLAGGFTAYEKAGLPVVRGGSAK